MVASDKGLRFEGLRFNGLLALVAASFLFGGASRNDVVSLIILQPLAVALGAMFLLTASEIRWDALKVPFVLIAALAGVMAIQLVPLPPAIWTQLPGHAPMAASAIVSGMDQPWRPISVTPDLTLSSIAGLVLPLAVLLGFASLPVERTRQLLAPIAFGCALSAFIGLIQIGGGPSSPLYFYRVTNEGLPVGLLANRNHQAVLLAMALPMVALWANQAESRRKFSPRRWIAAAISIFFVVTIIATGSRNGLACGLVALIVAFAFWRWTHGSAPPQGRHRKVLFYGAAAIAASMIATAAFLSRDEGLQRAADLSIEEDLRVRYLPTLVDMAAHFFPIGSGFGSFDPVLRMYEPFELLQPKYLNHAHNDLIEIVIVGGLPALLILIAFVAWVARGAPSLVRRFSRSTSAAYGCLGMAVVVIGLGSSLVDYPLRTPLHAALLAIAVGWIADAAEVGHRRRGASATRKGFTGNDPMHSAPAGREIVDLRN